MLIYFVLGCRLFRGEALIDHARARAESEKADWMRAVKAQR